jgi:glyoxylase-like metal-dependent hydrolase (beta-lactamase superfamily II)
MSSNLYLRQVLIGPMANYVYLIGDPETRETMVVDPAWDVQGIGHSIPGIPDLLEKRPVKIYMHKEEAPYVKTTLGLESSDFVAVDGETTVQVGNVPVRMIHTPGHTPGSLCFLVDGNLVSGDTLFIGACGRVDLPGASPEDLYYSLTQKLKKLPDETVLYPGHNYASDNTSTIGREKDSNVFMRFESVDDFLRMMGFPS